MKLFKTIMFLFLFFSFCNVANAGNVYFVGYSNYTGEYVNTDTGTISTPTYTNVEYSWHVIDHNATTGMYIKRGAYITGIDMTAGNAWIDSDTLSASDFRFYTGPAPCNFSYFLSISDTETITGITEVDDTTNEILWINFTHQPTFEWLNGTMTYTLNSSTHRFNKPTILINGSTKSGTLTDSVLFFYTGSYNTSEHTINISIPYNQPPDLYTPTNGSTISETFPPLYHDVTFTWENTGTTCLIQVAEDSTFSNIVYSGETSSATVTVSLSENNYYWRVKSYDEGSYGNWSDVYNFDLTGETSLTGTGVHGVVFEAESLENKIPLSSALVTIYNDTYSDTTVTGSEGYYQFTVSNGTYIVYASLSNYDTSALLPVTVAGNYTILNIPLIESESYFAPHYVRFVVTDSWYWERYEGATVTVYEGESTTALYTETTGTDGAVGFELSENIEYRIVTTYGDITQTDYISPTENTYYIVLEDIETSLLPDNQFYDIISINITKTEINSTNARINIVYNDSAFSTNSVYFVLGQSYENGTLNILDTSSTYTEDCNVTFYITGYLGQSYIIKAVVDHNDFGAVTKYFSVDFPSNNLPFTGKGVVYLCIIVLFVVAAQFGKADSTQGAILLCGLTWFMWGMDIFVTFGEGINSLIGVGLGISTAYAVLAYINKKRTEEGI